VLILLEPRIAVRRLCRANGAKPMPCAQPVRGQAIVKGRALALIMPAGRAPAFRAGYADFKAITPLKRFLSDRRSARWDATMIRSYTAIGPIRPVTALARAAPGRP